jgi:hypothetical protein
MLGIIKLPEIFLSLQEEKIIHIHRNNKEAKWHDILLDATLQIRSQQKNTSTHLKEEHS